MAHISWRGLDLGQGTPFRIKEITGWEALPSTRRRDASRANGHGVHASPVFADERIVMASGLIVDRAAADGLVAAIETATPLLSTVDQLAITLYGRTLTAGARVIERDIPQDLGYNVGVTEWAIQWACPDPLRYGAPLAAATGLPTSGAGLAYPLNYPLDYGALGASGQLTLTNPGTAPAPIIFRVTGALPQGFEISGGGQRLRYVAEVPAGQVVELNTGTGSVLVEGTANRRGNLTSADWLQVPPGGSLTVQFTSLGGAYDPAAQLLATTARAYW